MILGREMHGWLREMWSMARRYWRIQWLWKCLHLPERTICRNGA